MEFREALVASIEAAGWTDEKLAVALADAGSKVTAQSVWAWRAGRNEPRLSTYRALRAVLPGFADRIDGRVAA